VGATAEKCGSPTTKLDLVAKSQKELITVDDALLFYNDSLSSFDACYWHISADSYTWTSGATI
jgi:hypothetical protein